MSSGDDWDASDNEATATTNGGPAVVAAPVAARRSKFADEDAEEDLTVKDSWEDSDEEAAPKPAAPSAPSGPIRQKGITKAKIAEKEAAEAARAAEAAQRAAEDPMERKKRERQQQLEADLESAGRLFGGASIAGGAVNGAAGGLDEVLAGFVAAKTKEQAESAAAAFAQQITDAHATRPLYPAFAEALMRALAMPLKDLDVKKCASTLTALGNEKQKLAKEGTGKKGKGKGKPQLGTVSGAGGGAKTAVTGRGYAADLDAHNEAMDDYDDDFM